MKQKVRQLVKELKLEHKMPVVNLFIELREVLEEYEGALTFVTLIGPYREDEYYLEIYLDRHETDEEYKARLQKEKILLFKEQKKEIAKKENRFKQYLKLKEEFESDK